MTDRLQFIAEPFEPHPMMRNPHIQSIAGSLYRPEEGVDFRRVRLDIPDGDFLDVDFAQVPNHSWEQLGEQAPILLMLHGLEGDARKGYAIDQYRMGAEAGFRCVGINFRSCSGVMNQTSRFYHMGATDDVALVVDWLREQYPSVPMVMLGVSLGGNMLLKYLGECGESLVGKVQAGVAISPPIVATGKQAINFGIGALYGEYLLIRLRRKVRLKIDQLKNTNADPYRALTAKTLREFDEAITAPLHGFENADDYYGKSNSVNYLPNIQVPALILRSKDDPFFNQDIPFDMIENNPNLYGGFPDHGGHVGFIEGTTPFNYRNWAQRQAINFFKQVLDSTNQ